LKAMQTRPGQVDHLTIWFKHPCFNSLKALRFNLKLAYSIKVIIIHDQVWLKSKFFVTMVLA
jgi:hypothetical protein